MYIIFVVSEATAQQMSNKARTEFCAKHDSFADFCFVHHKTEPLIASEKNDKYEVISEASLLYFFNSFNLNMCDQFPAVNANVRQT